MWNPGLDAVMLVFYIFLALVFSFICSIAEAVLLSITPSYIEGSKKKHPKRAALLKSLKQDKLDQSLAAILTLNTIAHTVGAIGAGAKATLVFGSAWFGLFSAIMTLMILFISEIVPKTLGAVHWAKLAGLTAIFVKSLILVFYPLVQVSEKITKFIAGRRKIQHFNRGELMAMARVGAETGHLRDAESRIIRNLLLLESLNITEIMTPRTVISALREDLKIKDAADIAAKSPFSRLPVYKTGLDKINGFVLKNDILVHDAKGQDENTLASIKRDILLIPSSASLLLLMELFLKHQQHIALVVDEFGGTDGLITFEDLIESMMGIEIVDEADTVVDMRHLARKNAVKRARALGIEIDNLEK